MKFFIDEPKTYLSVNNKGRAMNQWISTFTHVLIPDELSRDAFIEAVRAKASMLDEEFPRTKPLRVDVSRNNDIHIEVYPDKNPYNTVFIVHIYPVRGEFRFCESTNPKIGRRPEMKEEGFNPNAVITDQVIDALANIQDHEPGSFREHTEKLTDILLDDFELMEPDNLKRNLDLVQFFRFYAGLIEKLHPQSK